MPWQHFQDFPRFPFSFWARGPVRRLEDTSIREKGKELVPQNKQSKTADNVESLLKVEPLAIEVGLGLIRLVEGGQNSLLLKRIAMIRRQLASEMGYVLPPVRVADNLQLKSREYTISVKGTEMARYELQPGCELAIQSSPSSVMPAGIPTREPAFQMPAVWVAPDQVDKARQLGYTVVDPVSVVGTHVIEIVRKYSAELFSRQETKRLLDRIAQDHPKVVEELVPKQLSLAAVQRVIQNLLRERASIRDAASILEALGEAAAMTRNPVLLTEYVRQAIRRAIVKPYLNPAGDLTVHFVDPEIERSIEGAVEHGENSSHLTLAPQVIRAIVEKFQRSFPVTEANAAVLTSSGSRHFLRQITEHALPGLAILGHNEVPPGIRVVCIGTVK